jgi:aromatic ring-cleaving dioxygenase
LAALLISACISTRTDLSRELILVTQTTGTSPRKEDTMSDIAAASTNRGYHAHIYYDLERTRAAAERLCAVVRGRFNVEFGGFRDEPVGPHPVANAQVIFKPEQFQPVVEWLMLHRDGLDVLIHPLTDNSVDDHSIYAMWLGTPVPLKLDTLRRNYRAELLPTPEGSRSV